MPGFLAAIGHRKLNNGSVGLHIVHSHQLPKAGMAIDVGVCLSELAAGYTQDVFVIGLPLAWGWRGALFGLGRFTTRILRFMGGVLPGLGNMRRKK